VVRGILHCNHSPRAMLTSTNVTTNRTKATSPITMICGVMTDMKSIEGAQAIWLDLLPITIPGTNEVQRASAAMALQHPQRT
jgi:hypothetical protein